VLARRVAERFLAVCRVVAVFLAGLRLGLADFLLVLDAFLDAVFFTDLRFDFLAVLRVDFALDFLAVFLRVAFLRVAFFLTTFFFAVFFFAVFFLTTFFFAFFAVLDRFAAAFGRFLTADFRLVLRADFFARFLEAAALRFTGFLTDLAFFLGVARLLALFELADLARLLLAIPGPRCDSNVKRI
jgi:hypothetical protein